jgi:hypothetical protein
MTAVKTYTSAGSSFPVSENKGHETENDPFFRYFSPNGAQYHSVGQRPTESVSSNISGQRPNNNCVMVAPLGRKVRGGFHFVGRCPTL